MKKPNRRDVIRNSLQIAAVTGAATQIASAASQISNLIIEENKLPGTLEWQLSYTKNDAKDKFRSPLIEGYASQTSISAGSKITFYVSSIKPGKGSIEIFRLGYYQGKGGKFVSRLQGLDIQEQITPVVGKERLRECNWAPTASGVVPENSVRGVYVAKLSSSQHRYQSYVIFIVKDKRKADFLFQCSDNTWQAYNQWPDGYSLYTNDRADKKPLVSGVKVSFDRPYGKYVQIMDNPLSQGSGEFLLWEFPLAYWMEKEGYDVSYISNSDVHSNPNELMRGKAFLSVGHDEYWSIQQFKNVKQAVEGGVHAAFLSGNSVCFVTPFSPSSADVPNRIITRAGRYGGIRPKEHQYMADLPEDGPNESTLIGAQTVSPFNGSGDWTVVKPDHWLFRDTGMKKGDKISGLVGWEFHGEPAEIPGLEVVAEGPTWNSAEKSAHFTATIYPGPKGNLVFNASTIFWAQGLSQPPGHMPPISHFGRPQGPDERVQQITKNLFAKFLQKL